MIGTVLDEHWLALLLVDICFDNSFTTLCNDISCTIWVAFTISPSVRGIFELCPPLQMVLDFRNYRKPRVRVGVGYLHKSRRKALFSIYGYVWVLYV